MNRHIVFASFSALAIATAAACWFLDTGGEAEFSPDTLERRSRAEYYARDWVVWRSRWSHSRDALTQFLVTNGYWAPASPGLPRWVRMATWRGRRSGHTPLQFELWGNWIEWSKTHPDLARRLWPYVLKLLRGPPLDYIGIGATDPDYIAADLLYRVRRVDNMADLQRDLDLFDRLAKPLPAGKAPK